MLSLDVHLSDRKDPASLPGLQEVQAAGVRFLGERDLVSGWPDPDLVVKSPGVPEEAEPVVAARRRGVPVWSEVELAYSLLPNPFDAITGTNGKTTTTALLGHLFATAGRAARILGNIGVPVTSAIGHAGPDEELVVEVSSFQLEDVHTFRPAVGVFLNLTPDHLDRHGSMERYLACKAHALREPASRGCRGAQSQRSGGRGAWNRGGGSCRLSRRVVLLGEGSGPGGRSHGRTVA